MIQACGSGPLARVGAKLTLIVIVLAWGVRMFYLDSRPLWYDEAFAVLFSERGPGALLYGTLTQVAGAAADVHPILYYTSLWAWMKAAGDSPFAVRFLSVLFGAVTLALVCRLAREMFGRGGATACGLIVAFAPFHVHFSQEARMYSMLAGWLMAATWAFRRAVRGGGWRFWGAFAVLAALAQYTHNLAALYLVPLALTPVWMRRWRSVANTAAAGAGALALYSPWLSLAPGQLAKLQQAYWTQRPGPTELVRSLIAFFFNLPLPGIWLVAGLGVAVAATALAGFQCVRAHRLGRAGSRSALWLFYLGAAPVGLMFAVSQWQPVYIERAMLPASLMLLCAVAWGLARAGMPRPICAAAWAALAIVGAAGLASHYTYAEFPNSPFPKLVDYLRTRDLGDARIVHSNKLSMLPSVYYDRALPQVFVGDTPGSGSDTLALPTQEVLGLFAEPNVEAAAGDARTVYFVIFARAIDEYRALGQPTHPHLAWLQNHFTQRGVTRFNDLLLYEFSR